MYLSSLGFGISITNIFISSLLLGIGSGLDTLSPQAIGARNYELSGHYLNQAVIFMTFSFLLLMPFVLCLGMILKKVGVNPLVAHYANVYTKITFVGFFLSAITELMYSHMKA